MNIFAEDRPYWDTTVHPAKSLGEIQELLDDFGTDGLLFTQGQGEGRFFWLVRFQWNGRAYRFLFTPLECQWPTRTTSFGGKRRVHAEQAKYQMGRTAAWFVKAILTAAEAEPAALFGFLELPGASRSGGMPAIAAELDVEGLTAALPGIEMPRLMDGQ